MNNLTLKQLRYFEALARHGHFGRAAEASAISQPALSMQIKDLEETLGAALVERGARHLRLTGFGEDVLARARSILRATDELEGMARQSGHRLSGRLRIGIIPTIAPYLLPKVLPAFAESFPDAEIHVRETLTPTLLGELADGKLDAAILALPVSEPSLHEMPLFDETFVLVRSEAESGKPVPDADGLKRMRLLLLEEGHCFRDQALSFCKIPNMARDGLDGSSLTTLVQMVSAGIGATLIPEMAVPVETRSAKVSISRFEPPEPSRCIGMVWRRTTPLAHHLADLATVVKDAA